MGFLIRVPIDDDQTGGHLLVEAHGRRDDLGSGSGSGHENIGQASQSLEKSFDDVTPALRKVVERLRGLTPGEFTVEFGLTVGTEGSVVVAKGGEEAHFKITATWKSGEGYSGLPATDAFEYFSHRSFRAPSDEAGPGSGPQR